MLKAVQTVLDTPNNPQLSRLLGMPQHENVYVLTYIFYVCKQCG